MPQEYDTRVNMHLDVNSGIERVTEKVHTQLVECGWRDKVRLVCRKKIAENSDGSNIPSVDELIEMVTPVARKMIHSDVKMKLLHEIEMILSNVEKSGYVKNLDDL